MVLPNYCSHSGHTGEQCREFVVLALFAVLVADSMLCRAETDAADSLESPSAFAATYVANRDSFRLLECTYELRQFRPLDEEEVFRGQAEPEAIATGLIVRSGSHLRREIGVSKEVLEQAKKLKRIVFHPQKLLLDSERGVTYSHVIHGGVLYSSAYPPEHVIIGPFDFGRFSGCEGEIHPGVVLEHPESGFRPKPVDGPAPDEPHAAVDPAELVGIEYYHDEEKGFRLQFFLSPGHGCLPIVSKMFLEGELSMKTVVTDLREIDEQRAFPLRSLNFQYMESGIMWALETRVTSLKVDHPVDPQLLRIEIEKGAALRDAADDNSQFKLSESKSVGVADFDSLFERAAQQSKQEALWAKAREETDQIGDVSVWQRLMVANVVLVLVVGLLYVILRIRGKNRQV